MLQVIDLSLSFGARAIINNASLTIGPNDRLGLVGPNGCGKTTFLRLISQTIEHDSGTIILSKGSTIGYLPQDGLSFSSGALKECVKSVRKDLVELSTAIEEMLKGLENGLHTNVGETSERLAEAQNRFNLLGGHKWDSEAARILRGLGFKQEDFARPCREFSGGWQMRIALARILLLAPDYLLLDEPTNHLDMESRAWLERYLDDYPKSVMVVSHDRHFLDRVTDRIIEIKDGILTEYAGNYTQYELAKAERERQFDAEAANQAREIAHLEAFIERFRYKATKAPQVQSRLKMLEKLRPMVKASSAKALHFSFPEPPPCSEIVATVSNLSKNYGELSVFKDVSFTIPRGRAIALVGANGTGKSTLLRILAGRESHGGTISFGAHVEAAYFAQDQLAELDPRRSVLAELMAAAPACTEKSLRNLLGGFLFSGDDIYKPISVLSGGERNRLALAKVVTTGANLLLLDEPTNHLDMAAKDVLAEALQNFGGTVLFVSHDRTFVEKCAAAVIEVGHGEANYYPESFADFLWRKARQMGYALPQVPGIPAPDIWLLGKIPSEQEENQNGSGVAAKPLTKGELYRQKQEASRRLQRLKKNIEKAMATIEELEAQKEQILAAMNAPENSNNYQKLASLQQEHEQLEASISAAYAEWEELSQKLEEEKASI